MSHSRRTFVKAATAGAGALVLARPGHAADEAAGDVLSHVGVALYTVRDQLKTKPKETLKAIADMGYRYIEGGDPEVWKAAKEVGADAVSFVHPESPSEFAAAVTALDEPGAWQRRSLRSVERAADFDWDASARQLLAAAEEAIALRSRKRRTSPRKDAR